ncbi:MAG TPA: protein phosphatase 2C domain-containing protein [Casimicrobiaceae bacterium]|nr:protein phosphatase 2C domain-containing protein [Casimicrobiaceae bacterium]
MTPPLLKAAALSDTGNVRQYNEDRLRLVPELGIVALADGMGGHRAGEIASTLATDVVVDVLRRHVAEAQTTTCQHALAALEKSIIQANQEVRKAAVSDRHRQGMGTTLVAALFHEGGVAIGHVGDSRAYRLRNGRLELLTRDDSLIGLELAAGLIAARDVVDSHNRSLVTQALGVDEALKPQLRSVDTLPGDVYLVCSDGLNDLVGHDDMELVVHSLAANLDLAARTLIETAKDNGGFDNVSVILVAVGAQRRRFSRFIDFVKRFA